MINKLSFILLMSIAVMALSCKNEPKSTSAEQKAPQATTSSKDLTNAEITKFTALGKEIAQASFKTLAGNMKKAMVKGGPTEAVKFCNAKAGHLVDSLSVAHKAKIKRTSAKLRNPANIATELEARQLATYLADIKAGTPMKPKVTLTHDNKVQFFAPIKMKAVCLTCHGPVGEKEHYAVIKELYPTDQATGYSEGDFRGIWSIEFDR